MESSHRARVAIITRTKNRPLLLPRAIQSVLGQTFENFIHVVVNDGGNPEEVELICDEYRSEYKDKLRVIHNASTLGMQNASNIGIQSSHSDFIAIHDDDDSWHESFLTECVSTLDSCGLDSSYQGVATQSLRVNERISSEGQIVEINREPFYPFDDASLHRLASDNLFPPIAFLYRRQVHDKIGYFNEKFTVLGDWDFNLRFLAHYDIATHKSPLAYYHWRTVHESSAYNNSVTADLDEHRSKLVVLQNHYLREDLKTGKLGLGHLLCNSKMLQRLSDLTWHNQQLIVDLQRKIQRPAPLSPLQQFLDHCWDLGENLFSKMPEPPVEKSMAARGEPGNIRDKIKEAKVLSLDVFDTALLRAVNKPTDVFMVMEPRVRELLGKTQLPFVQLRIQAERAARHQAVERHESEEITLTHIYEAFDPQAGWSQKLIDQLVTLELETELACLYANPALLDLYAYARELNLRVVYVSDMYLPSKIIREFLVKNGFEAETLFVSCEHGASKHRGELYEKMIKTLGVQPDQILHLGDNYNSDYFNAVRHGLKAVHVQYLKPCALSDQIPDNVVYKEGDLAYSLCIGLARRFASGRRPDIPLKVTCPEGSYWETLGYEVAGPIYFLFLHWLITKAKQENLNRLYFFSRDGYVLIKAFEILKKCWNVKIDAEYLFASRRLYNIAQIEQLDSQAMEFLLTPNPGLTVRDFLARCGLDPEPHLAKLHSLGLPPLDTVLTSSQGRFTVPENQTRLKKFFIGITGFFLERCREERERLYKYLDHKFYTPDGTAVVDIGWGASLGRSLQDLMRARGSQGKVRAFQFGSSNPAKSAIDAGCQLDSFFFHLDKPASRKSLIFESVEIVELLFSAPHPSVIGLRPAAGEFKPIYGEHEHDPVQLAQLERMRTSALKFVADAAEFVSDADAMPTSEAYIEAILDRVLRHPTFEEASILGKFRHRDGFGDKGALRYVANPLPSWQRVWQRAKLKHDYDHCYWKTGFRAQLTETQKRLIYSLLGALVPLGWTLLSLA